ncbi:MAG: hypothetical protein HYZ16_05100 [Bacteroidetes bacterium]|nr:hypothetical protein [Bacteroidota bacterium]
MKSQPILLILASLLLLSAGVMTVQMFSLMEQNRVLNEKLKGSQEITEKVNKEISVMALTAYFN